MKTLWCKHHRLVGVGGYAPSYFFYRCDLLFSVVCLRASLSLSGGFFHVVLSSHVLLIVSTRVSPAFSHSDQYCCSNGVTQKYISLSEVSDLPSALFSFDFIARRVRQSFYSRLKPSKSRLPCSRRIAVHSEATRQYQPVGLEVRTHNPHHREHWS